MATIKDENHSKIVKIDLDTATYILEKVADAVDNTLNDRIKGMYNEDGDLVGTTTKNYLEMFDTLSNKLQNIINEIKEKNDVK